MNYSRSLVLSALIVATTAASAPYLARGGASARAPFAISGPMSRTEGQLGTWSTNVTCASGFTHMFLTDGVPLNSGPNSHWAMDSFPLDSWCVRSLPSDVYYNESVTVYVNPATVCEGFNQAAPNYCKTLIGSASPDGAAPDEQCVYRFWTNLPDDSWVTWKINGNDVHSGELGDIGPTLTYTHTINQGFEVRVHVEAHVATHAEKNIAVGTNLTCNMTK